MITTINQLIGNFIANLVTPLGICKYFTENSVNKSKVTKGTVLPVCFGVETKGTVLVYERKNAVGIHNLLHFRDGFKKMVVMGNTYTHSSKQTDVCMNIYDFLMIPKILNL